jgi:aspartate carbamoyltransferase catalytic subunit
MDVLRLFNTADGMRSVCYGSIKSEAQGKVLATLFFEPSTRTRLSFEAAMLRLGGRVISAPDSQNLSVVKGESLMDTIETVAQYADVIAVRSTQPFDDWYDWSYQTSTLAESKVSIINCGDGPHNHPTQALLDAYTLWRHFGFDSREPLGRVPQIHGIVGDLAHSRTIRSYIQLMSRQQRHTFYCYDSTGEGKKVPGLDIISDVQYVDLEEFDDLSPNFDVLYLNRVQCERWAGDRTKSTYILTGHRRNRLKDYCAVLNPGPRKEELPVEADADRRVKMWEQVQNGLYLRMALLSWLLERRPADLL